MIVIDDRYDSTNVIYDRSDSGLCYKTTIVINLALARSVNYNRRIVIYDRNECYKLKCNLRSNKIFIVQATDFFEGSKDIIFFVTYEWAQ